MDLREQISEFIKPSKQVEQPQEEFKKPEPTSNRLKQISQENADIIKRSNEIVSEYASNRQRVKDLRIELNKSLDGMENPYKTLEIALEIIEILLSDKTYLATFREKTEGVKARYLNDPLAKLYTTEKLDGLIQKMEEAYRSNPDDRALRASISSVKRRRESLN